MFGGNTTANCDDSGGMRPGRIHTLIHLWRGNQLLAVRHARKWLTFRGAEGAAPKKMDPHGAEGAAPKKINISGAEGAAPENREKCTDCFTFGEDPIIELKQIIKLFHLSGCFTFQILAIIIELK